MSLLAVGRYKEPFTRLPTKLPNLNRLSVTSTPTKDVISSGGNPISYAPPAVPSRTINVFNQLERKEPKQKRISDLMDLFLQVQKNKFIKEGVIQQAFKPEKHSNNLNYLASINPDRAKEKMINAIQEALDLKTYNEPKDKLELEPTESIQLTPEEISKTDPNINARAGEEHLKQREDEKKDDIERLRQELEKLGVEGITLPDKLSNSKMVLQTAEKLEEQGDLELLNRLEGGYAEFLSDSAERVKSQTAKSRGNILRQIRLIRDRVFKKQKKLGQILPTAPQEPPLPPPLTTPLASAESEDQTQEEKRKLAIAQSNL